MRIRGPLEHTAHCVHVHCPARLLQLELNRSFNNSEKTHISECQVFVRASIELLTVWFILTPVVAGGLPGNSRYVCYSCDLGIESNCCCFSLCRKVTTQQVCTPKGLRCTLCCTLFWTHTQHTTHCTTKCCTLHCLSLNPKYTTLKAPGGCAVPYGDSFHFCPFIQDASDLQMPFPSVRLSD